MNVLNNTYELVKGDTVISITEAATFDRAFDYFYVLYPFIYDNNDYRVREQKDSNRKGMLVS